MLDQTAASRRVGVWALRTWKKKSKASKPRIPRIVKLQTAPDTSVTCASIVWCSNGLVVVLPCQRPSVPGGSQDLLRVLLRSHETLAWRDPRAPSALRLAVGREVDGSFEHGVEHLGRESPGEGVLLAHVEAPEHMEHTADGCSSRTSASWANRGRGRGRAILGLRAWRGAPATRTHRGRRRPARSGRGARARARGRASSVAARQAWVCCRVVRSGRAR